MDRISKAHRSWNMSRIRSNNTAPERSVRSLLHRLGYRFRLHDRSLPGRPDVVLPRYGAVVLVHGCFWHRHSSCQFAYTPKSRIDFWMTKFNANIERDRCVLHDLLEQGWHVITVWECELRNIDSLACRLDQELQLRKSPSVPQR